jgi:tellurite resistance protein
MINKQQIQHFPITIFAIVMGLTGLAIVYEKAHQLLGFPQWPFIGILLISSILFLNNLIVYSLKTIMFPNEVKKEFFHPIRMNFFPAISISMLLLSIAMHEYFTLLSVILWYLGTGIHTFLTLYIMSYWIKNNFEITHSNPAWFIPIVGNVIVPIVGVDILGSEAMIFHFSIGMFFWVVLFTIILNRIIFHHQLAEKFLPTLFILIAPPAVGFISYIKITSSFDFFAHFLLDIAYFFTLLLFFMGYSFMRLRFFVSWWAFTFPLDAITIASMLAYKMSGSVIYGTLASVLLVVSTSVIVIVAYKTLTHVRKKEICIEE